MRFEISSSGINAVFEDGDLEKAHSIQDLINSDGWKLIKQYHNQARELVIEGGKSSVLTTTGTIKPDMAFCVLRGMDEYVFGPERIAAMATQYIESQKRKAMEA